MSSKAEYLGEVEGYDVWVVPNLPIKNPQGGEDVHSVESGKVLLISEKLAESVKHMAVKTKAPDVPDLKKMG